MEGLALVRERAIQLRELGRAPFHRRGLLLDLRASGVGLGRAALELAFALDEHLLLTGVEREDGGGVLVLLEIAGPPLELRLRLRECAATGLQLALLREEPPDILVAVCESSFQLLGSRLELVLLRPELACARVEPEALLRERSLPAIQVVIAALIATTASEAVPLLALRQLLEPLRLVLQAEPLGFQLVLARRDRLRTRAQHAFHLLDLLEAGRRRRRVMGDGVEPLAEGALQLVHLRRRPLLLALSLGSKVVLEPLQPPFGLDGVGWYVARRRPSLGLPASEPRHASMIWTAADLRPSD